LVYGDFSILATLLSGLISVQNLKFMLMVILTQII
jgi:hypothetical protein